MVKLKICGIQTKEEIRTLIKLNVDYIGLFIHIPKSKRNLTPEKIRYLTENCSNKAILLTESQSSYEILNNIDLIKPHAIQLIKPNKQLVQDLKNSTNTKIMPVLHVYQHFNFSVIKDYQDADYLLLDSKYNNELGGTGKTHDWKISAEIAKQTCAPIFLAGGINACNALNAINIVNPYCLDVQSAVMGTNKLLDADKLKELLQILQQNK